MKLGKSKMPESENSKSIFCQWCETTTFHGWSDFYGSRSGVGRCIWSILLLVCIFMLTSCTCNLLLQFLSQEKWTTTVYEKQGYNVHSLDQSPALPFPSVTICNINRIKHSVAEKYNFTDSLRTYFLSHFKVLYPIEGSGIHQMASAEQFRAWRIQHNMTYLKILDLMGHGKCDLLRDFRVGNAASLGYMCFKNQAEDLKRAGVAVTDVISPEYGKCIQLNFEPSVYNISMTGIMEGISLILDVEPEEYLPDLESNFLDEGVAIQVDYDQRIKVGSWMMVQPSTHAYIGLQQTKTVIRNINDINIFPPPCTKEPKLRFFQDQQYTEDICQDDCYLTAYVEYCGCLPWFNDGVHRSCDFDELDICQATLMEQISKMTEATAAIEECKKRCTPACESSTIKYSLSTANFPSRKQLNNVKTLLDKFFPNDKFTMENLASRFAVADIYFHTLQVQVVERYEMYSLTVLMSQLGGSLGLWAGISILTLAHAIMYLLYGIGCSIFCCKNTTSPS